MNVGTTHTNALHQTDKDAVLAEFYASTKWENLVEEPAVHAHVRAHDQEGLGGDHPCDSETALRIGQLGSHQKFDPSRGQRCECALHRLVL